MDDWLQPLLRFLHYGALLGLFGLTAYRVIGLRWLSARQQAPGLDGFVVGLAMFAPLLSAVLMLVSIAAMMGQSVWATEWTIVEAMITSTSIGWAFIARLAMLSAALGALLFRHRSRFALAISAALYGLSLVTLPWSGHAAAFQGGLGLLHRLNDAVHLLAAGLWLGAICWFLCLAITAHRNPDVMPTRTLLSATHRFAPLGMTLVALVVLTGVVNAQLIFGLANSGAVLGTIYGQMLVAKVALVALMLLCGARNALISRRSAAAIIDADKGTRSNLAALRASLAIEVTLAVVVVGFVAMAGIMSPMN